MSDNIWIALIGAFALVIVLFMFRKRLGRFFFKANREGIETELQTHPSSLRRVKPASVQIKGTRQLGSDHSVDVARADVTIEDVAQVGLRHKLAVKPDKDLHKRER